MFRVPDRFILGLFGLLLLLSCSTKAFAWGSGHNNQARMVMDVLPPEVVNFFPDDLRQKIVGKYAHLPDDWADITEQLVGKDATEFLKKPVPGTGRDGAHDPAVCLVLLYRAFRDKNPAHAAAWMGAIIHAVGDHYCHIPLNAYIWELRLYKIKCAQGLGDLSQLDALPQGKEMLKKAMEGFKPHAIDDPAEELRILLRMPYIGMDYAAQRECRMATTYNVNEKPEILADGQAAMAELGANGAQMAANAIVSAWQYAKENKPVELTTALAAQADKECREFFETKPLEHDTVYEGTLDSHPTGPAVGVVVEPSSVAGAATFGYCGCVFQAGIMRAMKAAGIPYVALDIRKVEKEGLPSVDKTPLVVICSGGFDGSPPFQKYAASGGRFLWFGGRDAGLLGKLSGALKTANHNVMPVSIKYCDPNQQVVDKVSIKFLDELARPLGESPYKFVNNPNIAGWTTPWCNLQVVSRDADIHMLAIVSDGSETMNLGGVLLENGKARHIFLPVYLLVPFTLTGEQEMDFSRPTLDSVGKKVVLTSLRMLAPELAPDPQEKK